MAPLPWDLPEEVHPPQTPVFVVDTRRCVGCHACSVACKVEFGVPLGVFRMRVRWLQDPGSAQMTFLPLFSEAHCDRCAHRQAVGRAPACVSACPTTALVFGDAGDPEIVEASRETRELQQRADTQRGVRYRGHHDWQEARLNRGVALDPADEDITYAQR